MQQTSLAIEEPDDGSAGTDNALNSLADDETIDFITGKPVKLKGSEPVRQRIAKALALEYKIAVSDMEPGFPIPVQADGSRRKTKKADIAVFAPDSEHTLANLRRVVICKPEPKPGRTVTKIRTYEQARDDLEELELLLGTEATPEARYGMWTNGLDFFFLYKESKRFGATFERRTNWPLGDESTSDRSGASAVRLRRGEAAMLKTAFRRCHNYIHGNEGMPKDRAFWQFLYLLFTKMYDERLGLQEGRPPQFYITPDEPFNEAGRQAVRARIEALFDEVKKQYPHFDASDVLHLSPRALAFIVGELAPYDLSGTDMDVKGIAYQELVGTNLRGDRGQYFTPKGAVELMVKILDPRENESVLDPACGTGGFLRETLRHQLNRWREQEHTLGKPDTNEQLLDHQARLASYAAEHLFGADFDESLVRATQMSIMTFTGEGGNVYHMNSLLFPHGHYAGVAEARKRIPVPNSVDVVMTNPPFGTDIKIEDTDVLSQYSNGVARSWSRNKETGKAEPGGEARSMSPEQLFIQRAVEWAKPGGRIGIVLPNGILSNPGPTDEGIRQWILDNCWVLASIELPVETFIVEANVNILTSLLFLKKKTDQEKLARMMKEEPQDYPVFMAVAEKVGVDRRGNPVYKRRPDGEAILKPIPETQKVRINGEEQERTFIRMHKVIDNDLPEIAEAYQNFRLKYEEPGAKT
ncbi:methylation-associated defense system DNA methyltransferase MAD2 [Actinomadura verrucosospora]|nr:N-6 DNA methylase [Actinomadura verrucosospora]